MRKVILIVAPTLLAYLLLMFFAGNLMGLHGGKLWLLRSALWLIGITAAAAVVWFFWDKAKKEKMASAESDEAPAGGEEISVLIRQAEKKLAGAQLAKGAGIANLPAILVLGGPSGAKTSIVTHSGLEPELLAGQVYQDGNITATRSANLWYSHQTVFVEAGGKLLEDSQARTYLAKHVQPGPLKVGAGSGGQSPRAALVCVEIETITAGGQAMVTLARNLRARLGEIAQAFGIQLPVYVLFTKSDRLPFFADFVRNLKNDEAAQALGAAIPIPGAPSGLWAEEQAARLGESFDRIFRALADARPELLARENDATKLPGTYEFPREFKKLRGPMVQFLVDLCRPSQLTVGPYLRGFYFSGVRPVIVQETVPVPEAQSTGGQGKGDAREATAMFRMPAGGGSPAPRQHAPVSRKVPQWVFLPHFFNHVLLADRAAMGASGSSSKGSLRKRILLITAAALCLLLSIAFTVSFYLNRGLEAEVHEALQGTTVAPPAGSLAPVESLRRLETLRQSLETLTLYNREGAPLRYRWGLYVGNELFPDVRRLYFARFKTVIFGQTQNSLASFLGALPAAPAPPSTPGYDQAYDALKAYLITTSNHDKSTREFLSPVLLKTWNASSNADAERLQLTQKQFDFYSDELKVDNPFAKTNDQSAVLRGRNYLKQFGDLDRVYQTMKAGAPKATVNFNRQVAGSREYLVDSYEVAGAFTKDGWKFMSDAIQNPGRYVHGELWVLGEQGNLNSDPKEMTKPLLSRYKADFIKEWRAYLKSGSIVRYRDIKDAAAKLSMLSGGQSPLLALLSLASQNIPWDDTEIAKALQPVQYMEPPGSDRYTGPQNKEYVGALIKLQTSVDAVASSPAGNDAAANQALSDAREARNATNQLAAQNFNPDPEMLVQNLLLEPILDVEGKLRGLGPGELNAGGKGMCGQFAKVLSKYPFNPAGKQDATVDDVNSILKKPDGALWKFYEDSLKKFLTKQGNQYVPVQGAPVALNGRFVEFFTQASAFSDFLYAGGEPHFSYTLKPVPTEGIQKLGLEIDGQRLDFSGGTPAAKVFNWQPGGVHGAKGTYTAEGASFSDNGGIWAIFRLFGEADKSAPSGSGGVFYDWIIRTGKAGNPSLLPNGKPLTVRLELDLANAPPVFQKGFFSRLACVSEVAKP